MPIHIEINIIRSTAKSLPNLCGVYNASGRHPLHRPSLQRINAADGHIRYALPLAALLIFAGLGTYALAGHPYLKGKWTPSPSSHAQISQKQDTPQQGQDPMGMEETRLAQALADIQPSAGDSLGNETFRKDGEEINGAQKTQESDSSAIVDEKNEQQDGERKGAEIAAKDPFSLDRIQPLKIEDLEAFTSVHATPLVPRAVYPRDNPARSRVSVHVNKPAASYESRLAAAKRSFDGGHYKVAHDLYWRLSEDRRKDIRALMGLGASAQKLNDFDSAFNAYERILKIDPRHTDATVNLLGLLQKSEPQGAYERLLALWQQHPENPGVVAQLGLTSAQLGYIEDAFHYLGLAAAMEPQHAGHLYNLAVMADRQGQYGRAAHLYTDALQIDASYGAGRSIPRSLIYDRLAYLRRMVL